MKSRSLREAPKPELPVLENSILSGFFSRVASRDPAQLGLEVVPETHLLYGHPKNAFSFLAWFGYPGTLHCTNCCVVQTWINSL